MAPSARNSRPVKTNGNISHPGQQVTSRSLFYLLLSLLIFIPLFRASNRPLPLMVAELLAVAGLAMYFLQGHGVKNLPGTIKAAVVCMFVLPLLYLLPLPMSWWAELPGREMYAQSLGLLSISSDYHTLSILPERTEHAWLALLPPLAVFLIALSLSARQVAFLVIAFVGIAFLEAMLGLMQMGDEPQSFLRLGNPHNTESAVGTYVNRNHLAGLLEMALPLALAMLTATLGKTQHHLGHLSSLKLRLVEFVTHFFKNAVVYAGFALVILLGLVFTHSRSGVALAMLAVVLCTIAFARRLGGSNVFGLLGSIYAAGIGLAMVIGLAPVLQRFTADPLSNLRWEIYGRTLQGIGLYFPLGSGPGTYGSLFPHVQGDEINGFVQNAHNDYLEWLFEGGIPAAVLLVFLLVLYLRRWPAVWVRGSWTTFRFMQVGAGIGMLLMLLHSLTDFNLHIPANAVFFAFLTAVFFHPGPTEKEEKSSGQIVSHSLPVEQEIQPPLASIDPATAPRNPFLDDPPKQE